MTKRQGQPLKGLPQMLYIVLHQDKKLIIPVVCYSGGSTYWFTGDIYLQAWLFLQLISTFNRRAFEMFKIHTFADMFPKFQANARIWILRKLEMQH